MVYQITKYLKFLLHSTNQHGVHSPFVYDLVTQCFYDKTKYEAYEILAKHREALLNDTSTISVTDFGAGSRVFKSNLRKVASISKHAGISRKRQELLFRLSEYFKPKHTLELGTSLGMATIALAAGNPNGTITSVEGCAETSGKAKEHLKAFSFEKINILNARFNDFFEQKDLPTFEMVYIDGNHNKEATLTNFEALLPFVNNETVLIFDDIYWNREMTEAWHEIVKHHKVTVSIDTFQWGLVFFRSEQRKEHFSIRL